MSLAIRSVSKGEWLRAFAAVKPLIATKDSGRLSAFYALGAVLRLGVISNHRLERWGIENWSAFYKEIEEVPGFGDLVGELRRAKVQSIGIHLVDPIVGRKSVVWSRSQDVASNEATEFKEELYFACWNEIYRHLFSRPSQTLINAIESNVLPWKGQAVHLSMKTENCGAARRCFINDTTALAAELSTRIAEGLEEQHKPGQSKSDLSQLVSNVVNLTMNDLAQSHFNARLQHHALVYRHELLMNAEARKDLMDYITEFNDDARSNSIAALLRKFEERVEDKDRFAHVGQPHWHQVLDGLSALQSSILSQPRFCDSSGLIIAQDHLGSANDSTQPSLYVIFGLVDGSDARAVEVAWSGDTRGSLVQAYMDRSVSGKIPVSRGPYGTSIDRLFDELVAEENKAHGTLNEESPPPERTPDFKKWLSIVDALAQRARHEGHDVTYNVAYGPLSFCNSRLFPYEPVPAELDIENVPRDHIVNHVKGFYSIFGNRQSRGLWFNEHGKYCGVFENPTGVFSKVLTDGDREGPGVTVFARISGLGCYDLSNAADQVLVRVRNGELVNVSEVNTEYKRAFESLTQNERAVPAYAEKVSNWLLNALLKAFQEHTHGTSFVLMFDSTGERDWKKVGQGSGWRLPMGQQTKSLVSDLAGVRAPLASFEQLEKYADLDKSPGGDFLLRKLTEFASLDGGLWLTLSRTDGLFVRIGQQFIPLVAVNEKTVRLLDIRGPKLTEEDDEFNDVQREMVRPGQLQALLEGLKGRPVTSKRLQKELDALSFLQHSGTKTHSLWGMSITAVEHCICVVLSSDHYVRVFWDGREYAGFGSLSDGNS